ncbi:MAG: peptidase M24 [Paludibacter sp. 47-17]|jgi:Xaa-Pro aminopeptidase|nr:MAG: peptidase M24 [Paludibacter sp. 47-17]
MNIFSTPVFPELSNRWSALQQAMAASGADACISTVYVNVFYLTDTIYNGYFYLPAEGSPLLFVKRPAGLNGDGVHYIRKPEQIVEFLNEKGMALPRNLMVEVDELPYSEVERLKMVFGVDKLSNATAAIRRLREIKSEYEIGLLRHSGALHAACYAEIPGLYRPGMTDLDLSIEIERLFRRKGATGHFRVFGQTMELFMGSVIAGDNAVNASPYDFAMGGAGSHKSMPVSANGTRIEPGCTVMVDMGGTFTGYISDMSRVFSLGSVNELAYKAHQTALEIQSDIEAAARPGVAAADLYNLALTKVKQSELTSFFMGYRQQAGFVGHGIGIQINESPVLAPRSREVLQAGHVFALEPKFVIPGVGAVGVENSYAVHDSGIEKLTLLEEGIIAL